MRKKLRKFSKVLRSKRAVHVYISLFALFVVSNLLTLVLYQGKTYPNTIIAGQGAGGLSPAELDAFLQNEANIPKQVQIIYKDIQSTVKLEDIGVSVDIQSTKQQIKNSRRLLPLANILSSHNITPQSNVDETVLENFLVEFAKQNKQAPKNAEFYVKDGTFEVKLEKAGHTVNIVETIELIKRSALSGQPIYLVFQPVEAKITKVDLSNKLATLHQQQKTPITVKFGKKSKTFTGSEIASFYKIKNSTATLSDEKIASAVSDAGFGIKIGNLPEATEQIKTSIKANKPLSFTLTEAPKIIKNYTYCIALRGVSSSHLGVLSNKLASVLSDSKGWGLKGRVKFSKVSRGCDFTVWLSAAGQMPSFGGLCDSTWSCRSGSNVVINFTRWQKASPAWNASGGSLDNYRSMVINHEVGHWLGFAHRYCGGSGQLAPVMQQQSINLQGCKFNPWPTSAELSSLKNSIGI